MAAAPATAAAAAAGAAAIADADGLQPYAYQVGGHTSSSSSGDGEQQQPACLVDAQGRRFYKLLQAGERGDREARFYAAMQAHCSSGGGSPPGSCGSCSSPEQHHLMQQLAAWVPRSYGCVARGACRYLALDNLSAGYQQPCLLDAKLGFRTWYPWASQQQQAKYAAKDAATTQASLGFRLCGLLVQRADSTMWRQDRHWGKALTEAGVRDALRRWADNGRGVTLRHLCAGPGGLLEQLGALAAVFRAQTSWHFFSASLLVVYEGAAAAPQQQQASAAALRPALALIDFAHAFPTGHEPAAGPPVEPDGNLLGGLLSFTRVLQELCGDDAVHQAGGAEQRPDGAGS